MSESRLTFVFDEHFSARLIEILKFAGIAAAQHLSKHGWSGTSDDVWMPLAAKAGMIIVTCDRNEKTRLTKMGDFQQMGARVIFVGAFWGDLGRWGQIKWLVHFWEAIVSFSSLLANGECAVVFANGRLVPYANCTVLDLKQLKDRTPPPSPDAAMS